MFLVSVTTAVKVGNKPIKRTTTTGSMVKPTNISPKNMRNFWKEFIFEEDDLLFLVGFTGVGAFIILSSNK